MRIKVFETNRRVLAQLDGLVEQKEDEEGGQGQQGELGGVHRPRNGMQAAELYSDEVGGDKKQGRQGRQENASGRNDKPKPKTLNQTCGKHVP